MQLDKNWYCNSKVVMSDRGGGHLNLALTGDYIIRLDGTTCLQLWSATRQLLRLTDVPLQVTTWLQACHRTGIVARIQINEIQGKFAGSATTDQTDTWYRQLDTALQSLGSRGLTEGISLFFVALASSVNGLSAPTRLLHMLWDNPETFPPTASAYAEDIGTELDGRLECLRLQLQMRHIR